MRHFFIFLISLYQKYISPYKGFRCAYGCYHKTSSCSAIIKNIIAEQGLLAGWPLIKQQFKQCQTAYSLLINDDEQPPPPENESSCYRECKKETEDCIGQVACEIGCGSCDGLNFSLLRFRPIKKSIHQTHKNSNKYDIRE